ncbi:DMT family transporter [Catenulispora sp. NL8]|uniref:DMT family transporter n=1 Tax=Catenulispora pinistramenti TaxID=2705254 RepID=A0ABS5L3Q0_9ACTN|nr:DMT family transporter [Catenulispora pinistramenti]MBS2552987.1 DMT family transporter [Catenulispora pinistramenti]
MSTTTDAVGSAEASGATAPGATVPAAAAGTTAEAPARRDQGGQSDQRNQHGHRTQRSHTTRHILQGTLAMSILGASTAVSVHLTRYPVLGGQALRYTLAAAVFAVIVRRADLPRIRPTAREWLQLVLLSATGLVLFNVFVLAALRHTDAATLGSVVACSPLVLAVAGPLVARTGKRLRPGPVVGAAVLVVAGSAMVQGFGHGSPAGIVFAVLTLVCEALFSLLAVPLLPKFGELRVSAHVTAIAVPILLVTGLATDGTGMLRVPTLAETAALLYLALPLTVFAFLLWYRALSGLGPQRAGLLIGTVPVAACAASAALGVGTPGPAQLAGVAVVVAGIVFGLVKS